MSAMNRLVRLIYQLSKEDAEHKIFWNSMKEYMMWAFKMDDDAGVWKGFMVSDIAIRQEIEALLTKAGKDWKLMEMMDLLEMNREKARVRVGKGIPISPVKLETPKKRAAEDNNETTKLSKKMKSSSLSAINTLQSAQNIPPGYPSLFFPPYGYFPYAQGSPTTGGLNQLPPAMSAPLSSLKSTPMKVPTGPKAQRSDSEVTNTNRKLICFRCGTIGHGARHCNTTVPVTSGHLTINLSLDTDGKYWRNGKGDVLCMKWHMETCNGQACRAGVHECTMCRGITGCANAL